MKRVVVVQARMTSTRLPGKVLMDLAGRPMLAQQLRRLKRCSLVDDIVVATTANATDDAVCTVAASEEVRWCRGSEEDVLSRYVVAARESSADLVVRVTADCPLIDPDVTDRVIRELENKSADYDYAANVVRRTFPRGLDVEAMFRDVLDRIARLATSSPAREHVTYFLLAERPDLFSVCPVVDRTDNSDLRWTVDYQEDLVMVRQLYHEMDLGERISSYAETLRYVRNHPHLVREDRT